MYVYLEMNIMYYRIYFIAFLTIYQFRKKYNLLLFGEFSLCKNYIKKRVRVLVNKMLMTLFLFIVKHITNFTFIRI